MAVVKFQKGNGQRELFLNFVPRFVPFASRLEFTDFPVGEKPRIVLSGKFRERSWEIPGIARIWELYRVFPVSFFNRDNM